MRGNVFAVIFDKFFGFGKDFINFITLLKVEQFGF